MPIITTIRLLIAIQKMIEVIIDEVVRRQKAEDLEALKAAVSKLKGAKSDEEKREAALAIRAAFRTK